jgi:hypothetical protein
MVTKGFSLFLRTGMRHVQPLMRTQGESIKPKALSKTDILV